MTGAPELGAGAGTGDPPAAGPGVVEAIGPATPPALTVVVPCFNEAAGLSTFHARLLDAMRPVELRWDVLYVNDGSRDGTLARIEQLAGADRRVGLINLSRNFGKEIALTAGLDHARGTDAVVVIDADLQDPPELIPQLIAAWQEGYDNVYAQRRARAGESWAKRRSAHVFYRLMRRLGGSVAMPVDTGDYRLLSRRAVDAVLSMREHHRMMKGLFAWVGFPSRAVIYDRDPRLGGNTSWDYWRLWNFALEGITGFTVVPLKLATYLGVGTALLAAIYAAEIVFRTLLFGNRVAGYPSLMAVVLFLGGVQLITLGVIGEYLARVFNETKARPLYLVERHRPGRNSDPP